MSVQRESSFRRHRNQYVAAVTANLIYMSFGTMIGNFATSAPQLLSNETPLKSGPLTNDQLSDIGSINALSSIASSLLFGFIAKIIGCKRAILLLTLPSVIFYVLIYIGDTYVYLIWARLFAGCVGGGIQTVMIIFVAEISDSEIRGKLATISHLSRNIGILMAYDLGSFLPYKTLPCVFIFVPIIFVVLFVQLPNTPGYHLKRGNIAKAEESLRFYNGSGGYKPTKMSTLNTDIKFKHLQAVVCGPKDDEKLQFCDIFNRPALIGILNGSILASLAFLTGYMVFATYSVTIFHTVGASVDPYMSSVAFALLQVMGNLCTARFSDSLGRRTLLMVSLLGAALGMYSFSLYCYLTQIGYRFDWIPVTSFLFTIFIASCGVVPLMFLSMVEQIKPVKIRTVGVTICNVIMQLVSFTTLKLFPILMVSYGLHVAMLMFAIPCTLGAMYVYFVIKETKGMPINA